MRNELSDFEIEEFFGSLQELLVSFINNEYLSFDSAQFISRRFDGYERTLNVLTLRIQESAAIQFIFRRRTKCDYSYRGKGAVIEGCVSQKSVVLPTELILLSLTSVNTFNVLS